MIQPFLLKAKEIAHKLTMLNVVVPILIFFIALIPRILDLDTGLTTDERLWLIRSPKFFEAVLEQDWIRTYQAPHPGVTTMWVSGLSMHLLRTAGMEFADVLSSGRLPIALITSGAILVAYILLAKIFNPKIALLSAVLIALDPFFIAHSRFIHLDAMLTVFMLLSVLSLLAYLNEPKKKYLLVATGFFTGLALLTKLPALFLLLFIPFVILIWHAWKQPVSGAHWWLDKSVRLNMLSSVVIIAGVCGVTYCILWPAMWVAPIDTISNMITNSGCGLLKATLEPHGSGFFMGEISNGDYGALFYPVVILMRSAPLALIFSIICLGFILHRMTKHEFKTHEILIVLLALYIILFTIQMGIGKKALDRYLLPVFPIIDILAAIGIYHSMKTLCDKFQGPLQENRQRIHISGNVIFGLVLLACIVIQSCLIIPVAPYYHSYFNPAALGGPTHAPEILLVGWGEGNDLAAEYLNNKPGSENLTVAYQYPGFAEYFKGKSVEMGSAPSADYIVFYVTAVQRDWNKNLWDQFKDRAPEKIIKFNGIEYCWIYETDKSEG